MGPRPVLLVGELSQRGVEVFETLSLLNFSPVQAVFPRQKKAESLESYFIDDLPAKCADYPAVIATTPNHEDLKDFRLDRRSEVRLLRAIDWLARVGIRNWLTVVHPSAFVSPSAELCEGVFVGPLVSIASNTRVGRHTRIGRSSSIGHDVEIEDFCRLGPSVSIPGNVTVCEGTTIGIGACFLGGVQVGARSLVGAGSVVTRNVEPGTQVWGSPAVRR